MNVHIVRYQKVIRGSLSSTNMKQHRYRFPDAATYSSITFSSKCVWACGDCGGDVPGGLVVDPLSALSAEKVPGSLLSIEADDSGDMDMVVIGGRRSSEPLNPKGPRSNNWSHRNAIKPGVFRVLAMSLRISGYRSSQAAASLRCSMSKL